ncbi:hypothetical protein [Mycolicibacterium agri]|uniref:hypothetical protein n=1 Tax=Mycolicibacterium agri TaxID=36811 RepID=UPI002351CAEF|nr:hypothetical protein [Mycolicibacterium agri]
MNPDGPPLIGLGRHDNLFFNTGHGRVGWTMAYGSAPTPRRPHGRPSARYRSHAGHTGLQSPPPTLTRKPPSVMCVGDFR